MEVQAIIATMYQNDLAFIKKMNVKENYVVVNQTNFAEYTKLSYNNNDSNIYVISNEDRGLSKSRNIAIKYSNADICLVCDDDIVFVDDYETKIISMYNQLKDADVIIYDYSTSSKTRYCKKLSESVKMLRMIDLLKVSSVRISFKRDSIIKNNIKFDELFGAGSVFSSGEENLFLKECYKKGLKIYYYPEIICDVDFEESSWFTGFNDKYFQSKGALSYVFWGRVYHLYNLYFVVSKFNLYKKEINFLSALHNMYIGRKMYKKYIDGR